MSQPHEATAQTTCFAGFWVYRVRPSWRLLDRTSRRSGVTEAVGLLSAEGEGRVRLRGSYVMTGLRADADVMVWAIADELDALRDMIGALRRTGLGEHLEAREVMIGIGGASSYAADHRPAFMDGRPPLDFVAVYPFTKTADWYLLPDDERRQMMSEHGRLGRGFGVQANTLRSFGLGDAEHVVALEADQPNQIVDCMEALRKARVRAYTSSDLPIYLGRRQDLDRVLGELV